MRPKNRARDCRRDARENSSSPDLSDNQLFLSLPNDPPKVSLIGKENTLCERGLYEQLVTFDSEMSPLLSSVPFFIPREVDSRNEITALDPIFSAIGNHGLVQRGALTITHASDAIFRSR
jgi:hypothetical protein